MNAEAPADNTTNIIDMRGAIMILKCVLGCTADNAVDGNPALNVADAFVWATIVLLVGCGMTRRCGGSYCVRIDTYVHKNGGRAERGRGGLN